VVDWEQTRGVLGPSDERAEPTQGRAMVVVTAGYAECLACGEVCVGGCSAAWLREHARHGADEESAGD
jgi:hypothetical protein